jgi:transposase-like protein
MPARKRPAPLGVGLTAPLVTQGGGEVMVWERAADVVRLGGTITDAATRVGVARQVFAEWVRNGTRLLNALAANARDPADLNAHEQATIKLVESIEQAEAESKLIMLGLLDRAARGVEVRTVTVRLDAQGNEIDRVERTEQRGPDPATLRWRLERRWPDEFAPRVRAEVTGPDGGPIAVDVATRAEELARELRRHLAGTNGSGANGS